MLHFYSKESRYNGTLSIVKAEHARVVCEEVYKAIDDDVAWPHGGVMQVAFHNNVFAGLNFGFTTWATSGEIREESLSIFSNGSMTSGHVSESCTQ